MTRRASAFFWVGSSYTRMPEAVVVTVVDALLITDNR